LIFKWSKQGTFLIEALLAVSILGVALVLILQSYLSGMRGALFTRDYTLAMFLLENKVSELKISGLNESRSEEKNVFPPPYERFQYATEAVNVSEDGQPGKFNQVQLAVLWSSGKKTHRLETTTYIPVLK